MAPRANWKGFLRLSLVTCPVALYPATSDSEKISFNQINRNTGHRIKYMKVDADTGEEVSNEDIMKGYKVDTDTYIEVSKEELEKRRARINPNHRHRRVRSQERYRSTLSHPALLSRSRWESRARRLCRDPGNYSQHGYGGYRPRGADQPGAHHRAGAVG
jgi:hypothetical protein